MSKGPGYIARAYGTGRRKFLEAANYAYTGVRTPQPASKMCEFTLGGVDYVEYEKSELAQWEDPFARAAGVYLAAVNADPRNHFGKHALRRFDK